MNLSLFLLIISAVSAISNDWKSEFKDSKLQEVLARGGMHIGSGRIKRFIALDNGTNKGYKSCTLPNGKPGKCKPIKYCFQEEFKTNFIKFMDYMCSLDNSKYGACCPEDDNKFGPEGLAGDLPATATKEEDNDAILRIERAENRGCGVSTRTRSQIMDARPTNAREWPWMASVAPIGYDQYCGGALITDRHVITAAHCTYGTSTDKLTVRLGEYDFKQNNESRSYTFRVIEKREHGEYEPFPLKNDIAILKLHRPAVFNTYIWPICLPPPGLNYVNESATVIGWGTKKFGGPLSPILMEVSIPIWEQQKCVAAFNDAIFEENICAAGYEGGKDACQKDSGSPLMYQMPSGRWTIVGVVSWGLRCGEPSHPGVYTRIDKYLQWINDNVKF